MNVFARKLRSFLVHAQSPSRLRAALRRNLALLRAASTGRGKFLYSSPLGVRFVCLADNRTSLQLFVKGYQEQAEIDIARAWLRSGDRCIDVGANVGLLSAVFADEVGCQGAVLALEPSPQTFAHLVDGLHLLGLHNVVPVACCASDSDGFTRFFIADSDSVDAEEESMEIAPEQAGEFRQSMVPCVRLDELCGRMDGFSCPMLLKIDVEGAEPRVLEGASSLVRGERAPLVIAELHRRALANYGYTPSDVLTYFPVDRFERFFIPRSVSDAADERRHGHVYSLQDPDWLPIYSNFVALPRDGDSARRGAVRDVLQSHAGAPIE